MLNSGADVIGILHRELGGNHQVGMIELGQQALKVWVENMLTTNTISFKKFTSFDDTYWQGWPTSEKPTRQPLYCFIGGRFTFADVEAKK